MESSSNLFVLELPIPAIKPLSFLHPYFSYGHFASFLPMPDTSQCSSCAAKCSTCASTRIPRRRRVQNFRALVQSSSIASERCMGEDEDKDDVEVAEGYTMTKFCDKMIEYFMQEKPQTKHWRKVLVFRDDWKKYRDSFFNRCQARADAERDPSMKKRLNLLARKMKKVDDEIEMSSSLLKEIQENPLDLNAIVARRRKDFTGEFFRYLNVLSEVYDGLEDRDVMARLGAKCLSAVRAYDYTVEHLDTLEAAQSKLDDILNSSSLEVACEKINHLAKVKELDSSLILVINRTWAAAKESATMKNEICCFSYYKVRMEKCILSFLNAERMSEQYQLGLWILAKDIMYRIYKETRKALRNMAPPEMKLLKYLLNIVDPEERFSALATSFSPGGEQEVKDPNALYTTPKELHKWIKMMLDAYSLNKEETDFVEARQMSDPMVIQRLFILMETIEEEYMKNYKVTNEKESESESEPLD